MRMGHRPRVGLSEAAEDFDTSKELFEFNRVFYSFCNKLDND